MLKKKSLALASSQKIDARGTVRCTQLKRDTEKRNRGRPCGSCDLMSNSNKITSNVSGKTFTVPDANCKARCLIYAAECSLCNMQYIGQTTTALRQRINGHRSWMNKEKDKDVVESEDRFRREDEAVCANHIKTSHGCKTTSEFNSVYKFSVLTLNPAAGLDKAEQLWISKMVTMVPHGLNIDKPCGVADGLMTRQEACHNQGGGRVGGC